MRVSASTLPLTVEDNEVIRGIKSIKRNEKKWLEAARTLKEECSEALHAEDRKNSYTRFCIILAILLDYDYLRLTTLMSIPKEQRGKLYAKIIENKPIEEYYGKFTNSISCQEFEKVRDEFDLLPDESKNLVVSDRYLELYQRRIECWQEVHQCYGNFNILYCDCSPMEVLRIISNLKLLFTADSYHRSIVKFYPKILSTYLHHHPYEFVKCASYMSEDKIIEALKSNNIFHKYYAIHAPRFWNYFSPRLMPTVNLDGEVVDVYIFRPAKRPRM